MAIEIRELVIKALIVDDAHSQQSEADNDKTIDKQALIQECVDQVLKILKRAKIR